MGRASRDKGKRGELAAREALLLLTGREWRRSAMQARTGGEQPDLVPVEGTSRLHPEVKVGAAPPCLPALAQAQRDAQPGSVPFALVKRDRGEWVVVVALADLRRLVEEAG